LMQSGDARLIGAIESALHEIAPEAQVHAPSSPPVVGAALLGLEELGAGDDAQERARRELDERFRGVIER
jgi:hypothetical protein